MKKALSEMKLSRSLTIVVAFLAFLIAPVASHAAFTAFDLGNDGSYEYIIKDNDTGDLNTLDGVIVSNFMIGNFMVNVTTGVTKPIVGGTVFPNMDLNSIQVNRGTGTLRINFVEEGFNYNGALLGAVGGTTDGSVAFMAGYGEKYPSSATIYPINFGPFSSSAFSGTTSGLFFLSERDVLGLSAVITHTDYWQTTSFDLNVSPVPLPGTVYLLGSGLAGLVGIARWRRRK